MRDTPIIAASDVDLVEILDTVPIAKPTKGKRYPKDHQTGEKIQYLQIVTAFDVETSKVRTGPGPTDWQSWVYIWQWQIGDRVTVIGRTLDEFVALVLRLNTYLHTRGARLMVYIHNLAFEFQFLSGVWPFSEQDVFATDARRPLYAKMGWLELRCSARLSGYALAVWAENLGVDHQKLTGDLDYNVVRYPWTDLTETEFAYCVHDVLAVVECVETMLHSYGDTLYSIPYTATGYIRRRVKAAMRAWSPSAMVSMQNPLYVYNRLRHAFRGGDTHANKYHVGALIADVYSYDRSSSYPDVMVHCKFPMTKFREEDPSVDNLIRCIESGRAVLVKVRFHGLRLKDITTGNPYITLDQCKRRGFAEPIGYREDNGRILEAAACEMAITDIDFEIICSQYEWATDGGLEVEWLMSARYGYLPQPLIDVIISLYQKKTALKGVAGKELEYLHSKQEINSVYGMMCQRILSRPVVFRADRWTVDKDYDAEKEYAKATEKAFLNYAWAVWVTAWARYRLNEGIRISSTGDPLDFVYCDTDSVKCLNNVDFSKYNRQRIRDALRSGAHATDPAGVEHYMGVFESEGKYDLFTTFGAKRYAYEVNGKTTITIAGVPKINGSKQLHEDGGISALDWNYVFKDTGKLGSIANDNINETWTIDGHELHITRNVVLIDVTYKMTTEADYLYLINSIKQFVDMTDRSVL